MEQKAFVRIFLTFLLYFCRLLSGTQDSDLLQFTPETVVVKYGSSVSVNCSTNISHSGMGWEASQGSVQLPGVQLVTWTVERLTHWDINPICYMISNTGQHSRALLVIIYTPPDGVSIRVVKHTGPMMEGERYELRCDVQNVAPVDLLTVNWYKGATLVHQTNFSDPIKTPVDQSAVLSISPSRTDDGVQYWCEAELNLGPEGPQPPVKVSSVPVSFTVHFVPDFSNCSDHLWLKEGESLKDYCTVTGSPVTYSLWFKDGDLIDSNQPLNRTSTGNYIILVKERPVKDLQVSVMYGPKILCPANISLAEGEDFDPRCTAEGYPQPELTWLKDGERVDFPQKLNRSFAGTYELTADNGRNITAVHTLEIVMHYSPSEIVELQDESVEPGSKVLLNCSSSAEPRPNYTWSYNRRPNVRFENVDGVSMLHIDGANEHNIGSYTCTSFNYLGGTNRTVGVHVKGAKAACPLTFTPSSVTLGFDERVRVRCDASIPALELGLEFRNQSLNNDTFVVEASLFVEGDETLRCYGRFEGLGECRKPLEVTVYKSPDGASIRAVNHTGPMMEGERYELRCDVQNVAPVHLLTVNWYKGATLVNQTNFSDPIKTPVVQSAVLSISPSRTDDGVQYWCEAELNLGPEGSPTAKSNLLRMTVHYKPSINTTKLPQTVPIFHGYQEVLVCEADGHPTPKITWTSNNHVKAEGGNLTIMDQDGEYTCTAQSTAGTDTRVVTVIKKEDHLPLIAGFVALMVAVISLFFVSIYSIYYKNTKTGRYTLDGAKSSAQNGDVAQNGKDSSFPMKKIPMYSA